VGSDADDWIHLQTLDADASVESLDAGDGIDTLFGTIGSDRFDLRGIEVTGLERIDGGRWHDTILGSTGDDFLVGGGGRDVLSGHWGDDTYFFEVGFGHDHIVQQYGVETVDAGDDVPENGDESEPVAALGELEPEISSESEGGGAMPMTEDPGSDRILFGESITARQLWFDRDGNDLRIVSGSGRDRMTVDNWYRSENDRVHRLETWSGDVLAAWQVQQLVEAMAAYDIDNDDGSVSVPPSAYDALAPVIDQAWQMG
jgi:Ca2+-binding RTX toxin-like protein